MQGHVRRHYQHGVALLALDDQGLGPAVQGRAAYLGGLGAGPYLAMGGQAEFDAVTQEILQRGEPLWFSDLEPGPGERLYRDGDLVAAALERIPMPSFRQFLNTNPLPGDYPQFRSALDAHRAELDRILEVARRGGCRFRYDFGTTVPFNVLLGHVQDIRCDVSTLLREVEKLVS